MSNYYTEVRDNVEQIESTKQNASLQLNQIRNQVVEQSRAHQYFISEVEQKKKELFVLNYYANNLHAFLSKVQGRRLGY